MVCHPCYMAVGTSEAAYTRRLMGVGESSREQTRGLFHYPDCTAYLAAGYLAEHHQAQHGTGNPPHWATNTSSLYPRLYRVSLTRQSGSAVCQLEVCKGWNHTFRGCFEQCPNIYPINSLFKNQLFSSPRKFCNILVEFLHKNTTHNHQRTI